MHRDESPDRYCTSRPVQKHRKFKDSTSPDACKCHTNILTGFYIRSRAPSLSLTHSCGLAAETGRPWLHHSSFRVGAGKCCKRYYPEGNKLQQKSKSGRTRRKTIPGCPFILLTRHTFEGCVSESHRIPVVNRAYRPCQVTKFAPPSIGCEWRVHSY